MAATSDVQPQPRPLAPPYSHVDTSGLRPVIRGTDIKVSQIAREVEHLGMSTDDVVAAHPHVSLAAVHAALAYYFDNQAQICAEWDEASELVSSLRARHPSRVTGAR